MGILSRIGVSLDSELLERFDSFIADKGYENRSEAFRDLIRDRLVGSAVISGSALVVGTVTLIYDHHTRLLPDKLTDLQHESHCRRPSGPSRVTALADVRIAVRFTGGSPIVVPQRAELYD